MERASPGRWTVVRRALAAQRPRRREHRTRSPLSRSVGGLEIAFLTGVILGAASRRVPVLLDGFVTGAAALVGRDHRAGCRRRDGRGHALTEPGHPLVLDRLGLEPLLDLRAPAR